MENINFPTYILFKLFLRVKKIVMLKICFSNLNDCVFRKNLKQLILLIDSVSKTTTINSFTPLDFWSTLYCCQEYKMVNFIGPNAGIVFRAL